MQPFLAKHRPWLALGAAVGALLIFGLVFQPLVSHWATSSARERGWSLEIGQVRLGARGLWLKKIKATRPSAPGFRVALGAVVIPWARLFSRSTVVAYGGTVQLPESLKLLSESMMQPARTLSATHKNKKQLLHLTGIAVSWSGGENEDDSIRAWGVAGDIASDDIRLTVDRIEAVRTGCSCVFEGTELELGRAPRGFQLHTLRSNQANVELNSTDGARPLVAKRADPPAAPRDVIERFVDRMNDLEHSVQRLREAAQRFATSASVEIPTVNLRWSHGSQKLNIGPFRLQAGRESDSMKIALEQRNTASDDRRFLEVQIPMNESRIEISSEMGFVSLQELGIKEADFGLKNVDTARLRLSVKSAIDELRSEANVTATGEVLEWNVNQAWLASRTVAGISGAFVGRGVVEWKAGFMLKVDELSLSVGQARLAITGNLERTVHETRAKIDLSVPLAACESLIESLPSGLAPLASQLRLDGTLALQAAVTFDTAHPERTDARWDLANGCRVRARSPLVAPERFREPFILEVPDAQGALMERAFGPGTASWVSLGDMSPHLTSALLVCEDGRFFHHNGFDSQAIRSSIRDNLLKGRFIRGGSTVSMQLAKNLYLRREKTFARKLQEAALTLLIEQSFSKNEILELYWNVVELGPGIYGVGEAARFYFGTTAAALSPAQAFYLASILPNPKSMHFAANGRVSSGWLRQIRRLLTIAHARHYLSDEELRLALEEELQFGAPGENAQTELPSQPASLDDGSDNPLEGREHD